MNSSKKFVIVGLSGGVDSAVAALRLQQQGYQVAAIFMQNWRTTPGALHDTCPQPQDLQDAETVCDILNISLQVVDFADEYWQRVFQHFLNEYAACRTPNPDILCNKEIKFRTFLDYAKSLGADYIATGHYVRHIIQNGKHLLGKGKDDAKDQSYFFTYAKSRTTSSNTFSSWRINKTRSAPHSTNCRII